MSDYRITQIAPGFWVLEDVGINLYLVAGADRGILMDTGFGGEGLRKTVETLCGLPVDLVHTHAHGDHVSGDGDWTDVWLHPAEWQTYRADHAGGKFVLHALEDGMTLNLGGRTLEVLHMPGHSPGSVAFLDRQNRLLFAGDTVMEQPVFLMFNSSSIPDYCSSLKRFSTLRTQFDRIYPTHRRWPLDAGAIDALRDCARRALEGDEETLVSFSVDLVFDVANFKGYTKDGFAVAVATDGAVNIPGVN